MLLLIVCACTCVCIYPCGFACVPVCVCWCSYVCVYLCTHTNSLVMIIIIFCQLPVNPDQNLADGQVKEWRVKEEGHMAEGSCHSAPRPRNPDPAPRAVGWSWDSWAVSLSAVKESPPCRNHIRLSGDGARSPRPWVSRYVLTAHSLASSCVGLSKHQRIFWKFSSLGRVMGLELQFSAPLTWWAPRPHLGGDMGALQPPLQIPSQPWAGLLLVARSSPGCPLLAVGGWGRLWYVPGPSEGHQGTALCYFWDRECSPGW